MSGGSFIIALLSAINKMAPYVFLHCIDFWDGAKRAVSLISKNSLIDRKKIIRLSGFGDLFEFLGI